MFVTLGTKVSKDRLYSNKLLFDFKHVIKAK